MLEWQQGDVLGIGSPRVEPRAALATWSSPVVTITPCAAGLRTTRLTLLRLQWKGE